MDEKNILEQRFNDFKDEIIRAITETKDSLGGRISELTGELKAYATLTQMQGNQLTKHDTQIEVLQKNNDVHNDKLEKHSNDIIELKTINKENQKSFNRTMTFVTLGLAILQILLKFLK